MQSQPLCRDTRVASGRRRAARAPPEEFLAGRGQDRGLSPGRWPPAPGVCEDGAFLSVTGPQGWSGGEGTPGLRLSPSHTGSPGGHAGRTDRSRFLTSLSLCVLRHCPALAGPRPLRGQPMCMTLVLGQGALTSKAVSSPSECGQTSLAPHLHPAEA